MLKHMLSNEPFFHDISITVVRPVYYGPDIESLYNIIIESSHERARMTTHPNQLLGATLGRLRIVVMDNEPKRGFRIDGANDSDWTRGSCVPLRTHRVEFKPFRELRDFFVEVQTEVGEVNKFRNFIEWDHGVYLTMAAHYALYHSDFNVSYPVMAIIAAVIKEHYRLIASNEAPLPPD
jgi:hypothetical protein